MRYLVYPVLSSNIDQFFENNKHSGSGVRTSIDHFNNKKVLIAEDNVVNQKVIHRMLERLDMIPHVVVDGAEAVKTIEENRDDYDLILMDCQMPVMDGFIATKLFAKQKAKTTLNVSDCGSYRKCCRAIANAASKPAWTTTWRNLFASMILKVFC